MIFHDFLSPLKINNSERGVNTLRLQFNHTGQLLSVNGFEKLKFSNFRISNSRKIFFQRSKMIRSGIMFQYMYFSHLIQGVIVWCISILKCYIWFVNTHSVECFIKPLNLLKEVTKMAFDFGTFFMQTLIVSFYAIRVQNIFLGKYFFVFFDIPNFIEFLKNHKCKYHLFNM